MSYITKQTKNIQSWDAPYITHMKLNMKINKYNDRF